MAVKKDYIRKMPGRIVGATVDAAGRRGYVLTLQAREQHIRREKATSNICSNEALCALRATVYLALLGSKGFAQLAQQNFRKAEFAKSIIKRIRGVRLLNVSPTFNEFVVELPKPADAVIAAMAQKGFACGLSLGHIYDGMEKMLLVAVTEKRTKDEIVAFTEALEEVVCN